jgi:predicted protein tyrosine phosphatase
MNLLFVCRYNEMRSCTAETIYAEEGYPVRSAGTEIGATVSLSNDIILWADLIFVMEEKQKVIINSIYADASENKKIIILDIPDNYHYMEPELVELIKSRVAPYLNKRVCMNLVGLDGNAFSLMGAFSKEAKRQGWKPDEIKTVIDECKSGDYDHLLFTLMQFTEAGYMKEDEEYE